MNRKVLVIGELNVDIILNNIQGFPEMGTEKLASDMQMVLGSSSAIFAANLATLGHDVSFLGMIGDDKNGNFILQELQKKNVTTDQIIRSNTANTGATIVLNYDMDRAMVTYPGAMTLLSREHIDKNALSPYDHVHISSVFLQPQLLKGIVDILSIIRQEGLTISIDPQWDPKEEWNLDLTSILPYLDFFIPNMAEIRNITKKESLDDIYASLGELGHKVIIKNGDQGAVYLENGTIQSQPAYLNDQVVDCIGAGDSFNAGFVAKFLEGSSISDCIDFGNITGAINTLGSGGTSAFTSKEDILKIAQENYNYNSKYETLQ